VPRDKVDAMIRKLQGLRLSAEEYPHLANFLIRLVSSRVHDTNVPVSQDEKAMIELELKAIRRRWPDLF